MAKSSRFLVTAVGTVAGSTIVSELKKYDANFYIFGADINAPENIATSKDVDEFFVFPKAVERQDEYLQYVLNFCKENHVDYVYAIIDEEVYNLSSHAEQFEAIGTKLCLTDKDSVRICHYKNDFYEWVESNFPEYLIKTYSSVNSIAEEDFPLFIKPVEGRASIGCRKIESINELGEVNTDGFVIQQFTEGDVFVVDVIRSKHTGEIQICQRKELLRNGNGCGIAVEIVNVEELNTLGEKIARKLDLNGITSIELFKTDNGFKIIEINPRLPAGTSYSCMAGCNTVINMLRISEGRSLERSNVKIGARFARRYETYEM